MTSQSMHVAKISTPDLTLFRFGVQIRYRSHVERLHDVLSASVLVTLKTNRLVVITPARDRLYRTLLHFSNRSVSFFALHAMTVIRGSVDATH
jgi:hypothetical protein